MKVLYHILYPDGLGDDRFIYDGFRHAFEDMGHTIVPLTERDDLAQTLDEVKPDLFITGLHQGDFSKLAPVIKKYREKGGVVFFRAGNIKLEMLADPYYKNIVDLAKTNQLADVYYCEARTPFFKELTGHESRHLPLAADKHLHFPVAPVKKYECDIMYIGSNLPMKRTIFERRLYPLFKKYNVKVFGGDWDWLDKYILHPLSKFDRKFNFGGVFSKARIARQVPIGEENQAYASAKIALNFHEQYADHIFLNGRTFKIPASGGFEICDSVLSMREYFAPDELVMPENDDDFFKKVEYYLTHEKERKAIQEKGTAKVLREHTYHNRVQTMLSWYAELRQKTH